MRILLIEDHSDLAANIAEYLVARSCTVETAGDGEQGLAMARRGTYDVLIIDRMLPKLDGLRICHALRHEGRRTPTIMLTAMGRIEEKLEGFAAGTDDYLVKPFALSELWVRLQALVRRGGTGSVLKVEDLEFDRAAQTARRGPRTLTLNPTARRLLEHLMLNSGRLATREELELMLWGSNPPDSDALRTHIHSLRKVLDEDGEPRLLHTVHGSGWRLSVT